MAHTLKKWLALLALLPALAHAQAYNVFQPGGSLQGTWNLQSTNLANAGFILGNLQAANQQSIASPNFLCNNSGATGAAGACPPIAAAVMMSAVVTVDLAQPSGSGNLTLSGIQTVDGASTVTGEFILVGGQTTASQNGIYVANSGGAWTRAANFPAGYVIGANCEVMIVPKLGTNFSGRHFYLDTSSGAITIGTTSLNFHEVVLAFIPQFCKDGSSGLNELCQGVDGNSGHLVLQNNLTNPPTASAGTLDPNSTDQWGNVTGLSAATTLTITFFTTFTHTPSCIADDSAATAVGVTAISATAVTFSMTALTGSLHYICLGTN